MPLDPEDSLRALFAVLGGADPETAAVARSSFDAILPDRLATFVRSGTATPEELDLLARESSDPFVLEEIVRSRAVRDETLLHLAKTVNGRPQDALIANQARLLAEPAIIRALFENPGLTADGRRLLVELTEEFFEKRVRRPESEAQEGAVGRPELQTAVPPVDEAELEADLDLPEDDEEEGPEAAAAAGDASWEADENSLFIGAIYKRLAMMNVSEKIKLAYTGTKEERRILVGDTNKLVGIAVLKSRAVSVNEVEGFAAMRNLDEEIYRRISWNREWMRKPAVVVALVRNPRVPLDIVLPLLKRLSIRELRAVFRDRNLAPVIRTTARRFLVQKRR